MSCSSRCKSLSVNLEAETSRMAATASVADPPKNVCMTCASAERDADSRERVGRYTYFVPDLPMPKQPLLLQHPDHGADRRVRRRIGQLRENLRDRSLSELIDGIQDLAFSRAETVRLVLPGHKLPSIGPPRARRCKGMHNANGTLLPCGILLPSLP